MKKLILALTLVMMSLGATAKNADRSAIKEERLDSIRVEFLNQDTDFRYPHWYMEKTVENDSVVCNAYFFKLGSKTYKATKEDLVNACIGKRLYGNYFIYRKSDGKKQQFFFSNYNGEDE